MTILPHGCVCGWSFMVVMRKVSYCYLKDGNLMKILPVLLLLFTTSLCSKRFVGFSVLSRYFVLFGSRKIGARENALRHPTEMLATQASSQMPLIHTEVHWSYINDCLPLFLRHFSLYEFSQFLLRMWSNHNNEDFCICDFPRAIRHRRYRGVCIKIYLESE